MKIDQLLTPEPMTQAARAELRARLLAEIATQTIQPRRPSRRRFRLLVAGAALAGVSAGGTAIAAHLIEPAPVTDHSTARCYSKVSNDFGKDFPGTTVAAPISSDNSGGRVVAPISACRAVWTQTGLLQGIPAGEANPPYPPPADLTGCVLPDGTAAVFPAGPQVCQSLGLPPAISDEPLNTTTNP